MDNAFTIAVLVVAVVSVLAATRPSRPPARRRESTPAPQDPPGPPPLSRIAAPQRSAAAHGLPSAPRRRWDRRDLALALAVDLVAPGAEGETWPQRG